MTRSLAKMASDRAAALMAGLSAGRSEQEQHADVRTVECAQSDADCAKCDWGTAAAAAEAAATLDVLQKENKLGMVGKANHFETLPKELLLLLLRCTLEVDPSGHDSLRSCCKEWTAAVDSLKTSVKFPLESYAEVGSYLTKLPVLHTVAVWCVNKRRRARKVLTHLHSLVPGLTSLRVMYGKKKRGGSHLSPDPYGHRAHENISTCFVHWRQTLRHLELWNINCINQATGGMRFLSELGALQSLVLRSVSPALAPEDLIGCTSLQKLSVAYSTWEGGVDLSGEIRTLDVSSCPSLLELNCSSSSISHLILSKCASLQKLNCSANKIRILDVSDNTQLVELQCMINRIECLDVRSCTSLESLGCQSSSLSTLKLPHSSCLRILECGDNQFTSLDLSQQTALQRLTCGNPQLTSLDVSSCTALQLLDCVCVKVDPLNLQALTSLRVLRLRFSDVGTLDLSGLSQLQLLTTDQSLVARLEVTGCTALSQWYHYSDAKYPTCLDLSACSDIKNRPSGGYVKSIEFHGRIGNVKPGMTCKCCTLKSVKLFPDDIELAIKSVLRVTS